MYIYFVSPMKTQLIKVRMFVFYVFEIPHSVAYMVRIQ